MDTTDPVQSSTSDPLNIVDMNANVFQFHESFLASKDACLDVDNLRLYGTKIFGLYFAQVFKIWKLFIENDSLLEDENKLSLFNCFLSHLNIIELKAVDVNVSKLNALLEQTEDNLADFSVQHEGAIKIYHSLACIHLLLRTIPSDDQAIDNDSPVLLYDCTNLFGRTSSKQWAKIYKRFDSLALDTRQAFLELMLINYKHRKVTIINNTESSNKLLQQSLGEIITLANETNWQLFERPELLEFLIPQLSFELMSSLMEKMYQSYQLDTSPMHRFLASSSVWENKNFQSVFITETLKTIFSFLISSKRKRDVDTVSNPMADALSHLVNKEKLWCECIDILPNSNEPKSAKLVKLLRKGAEFINVNSNDNIEIKIEPINRIMAMLAQSVPFEYLSPINQLRLMFTLTGLLFASSRVKSLDDRRTYAQHFVQISLRLWDSVRSQWLYDFVPASEYILRVLVALQDYLDTSCYGLLTNFIDNMFTVHNCEQSHVNATQLVQSLGEASEQQQLRLENVLMVQTILLQSNGRFIKRLANYDKFRANVTLFEPITQDISGAIYRHIKAYLERTENEENIESPFIVEGLTKIFEFQVFTALGDNKEGTLKSKWRKLLVKFVNISVAHLTSTSINLSFVNFLRVFIENKSKCEIGIGEDFVVSLWDKLLNPSSATGENILDKFPVDKIFEKEKNYRRLCKMMNNNIQAIVDEHQQRLEEQSKQFDTIKSLIVPIAEMCQVEEFQLMMDKCRHELVRCDLLDSIYIHNILNVVCNANLGKAKCLVLKNMASDLLTASINLLVLLNKAPLQSIELLQSTAKVNLLKLIKSMVAKLIEHDLLLNSHLFLVYNVMAEMNLMQCRSCPALYGDLFVLMANLLQHINTRRPHLVLMSMPTQLSLIVQLLSSLMRAADEKALANATDNQKLTLEACSKAFQQLVNQLASLDHFRRPYACHLLAHYLQQQSRLVGVIVPEVRKHLTSAALNLIRSIKDQHILEQLHSKLGESSREVLRSLLEHYDKYHRFKGYV